MLQQRIREVFPDMVVLKDPKRSEFFSNLSLPSYMRDWLVMKFSDQAGAIDYDSVLHYIKKYIPDREGFELLKYELVNGESIKFLARIRVSVNIKNGQVLFELPDFGGTRTGAGGEVEHEVSDKWKDILLCESENWGIIELIWVRNFDGKKNQGMVKLVDYKPFCPYKVDLSYYRDARRQFDTQEWIDVLISAVDYNPSGYTDERQKLYFLRRLLPFVEKRINLIELAPKGTGKSYVYEKISKRGWLVSGGTVSRATLIYDNAKKWADSLHGLTILGLMRANRFHSIIQIKFRRH